MCPELSGVVEAGDGNFGVCGILVAFKTTGMSQITLGGAWILGRPVSQPLETGNERRSQTRSLLSNGEGLLVTVHFLRHSLISWWPVLLLSQVLTQMSCPPI